MGFQRTGVLMLALAPYMIIYLKISPKNVLELSPRCIMATWWNNRVGFYFVVKRLDLLLIVDPLI